MADRRHPTTTNNSKYVVVSVFAMGAAYDTIAIVRRTPENREEQISPPKVTFVEFFAAVHDQKTAAVAGRTPVSSSAVTQPVGRDFGAGPLISWPQNSF